MVNKVRTPSDVPLKRATVVPVEILSLDRDNPRLLGVDSLTTANEIIAQLYRSEDLSELLQSIAANGYLDIEPLVVLRSDDRLDVLEGNRRLAAILLFLDEKLVNEVSKAARIRISLPEISDDNLATLKTVSVYRVASRDDARSYIGFKHINGAARWASYAKAKFAADWYRKGDTDLKVIAERIGDRHDTIKRMVNAVYVLEQADAEGIFRIDDRIAPKFNFSHLYTALSRASYMDFLGLDANWAGFEPSPSPVKAENLNKLGEVLRWIYGSKAEEIDPVVQSQNPDIKDLGNVLCSAEGLKMLRARYTLKEALASAQPVGRKLSEALIKARTAIRVASNNLRGFDGQDRALFGIAEDVTESALVVRDRMKQKLEIDGDA